MAPERRAAEVAELPGPAKVDESTQSGGGRGALWPKGAPACRAAKD